MRKLIVLIVFFITILTPIISSGQSDIAPDVLRSRLRNKLTISQTPGDSLKVLYDMFDIVDRRNSMDLAMQIFETAGRANDNYAQNDILRQVANYYNDNDTIASQMLVLAEGLPDNMYKTETVVYLTMVRDLARAINLGEEERQKYIQEIITKLSHDTPEDLYEHITLLFSVCSYLNFSMSPGLSEHYFAELSQLVEKLPREMYAIRNTVYVRGANLYSDLNQYKASIAFSQKLLTVIDSLEVRYERMGRHLRNYNPSRYVRYNALLRNYPGLTESQIEEYYKKVKYYASRDSAAADVYRKYQVPTIHYLMAKKQYADVLPILKRQINLPYNKSRRKRYLKYMIEAATAVGDNQTLKETSNEYIRILEDYIVNRAFEKYRELQILYDVYDLRAQNDRLELSQREQEVKSQRTIIIVALCFILVFLVLIFILFRLYRRAKHLSRHLVETNDALLEESANLRAAREEVIRGRDDARKASRKKSDFIRIVGNEVKVPLQAITEYSRLIVDCTEGEKKQFLERYADLVERNSTILNAVVNDVINLSDLDNANMSVSYRGVKAAAMCKVAIGSVAHSLKPGVEIVFDEKNMPDITVSTDPRRVEQVLINLLTNAIKFTDSGTITVFYEVDNQQNRVVFTVRDTGIGIPPEKKDAIFERFVKLDKFSQGAGIGLTIAQMLIRLVGGDLRLDTSYKHGASFRFFIPFTGNVNVQ